jgi:pantetheine-phosphate adenylyltransferase
VKICVFPGTFDPLTLGHKDIILRARPLFDKIIIGIGLNSSKKPMFSVEQRLEWINDVFAYDDGVSAQSYEGLTIDFCKKEKAEFILRGIRYVADFEYERAIADMNAMLADEIETIFLTSSSKFASFSSTLVRDVYKNGGDVSPFIPEEVKLTDSQ